MKRNSRHICVVGLGHFGSGLARSLARHCEVLALDNDINRVNAITEDVQRALCLDARDFAALASVVSSDFDEAVVSIGESLEASILCTLHLKRIGVPVIRAKADSADHADILKSVGAEHIVFPERETAERLALQMLNPNLLDFIPLAKDYRVMDIAAPGGFCGRSLISLQIRNRFGLFVIAIKKHQGETFVFLPGPEQVIEQDDVLVMIGREFDILKMREAPGEIEKSVAKNGNTPPATRPQDVEPKAALSAIAASAMEAAGPSVSHQPAHPAPERRPTPATPTPAHAQPPPTTPTSASPNTAPSGVEPGN
ncbi:MAG TPA: NAD-binding protein [Myxococcota bacterium]|nr:NAD-binding protein [Myxococcota bacterium]